MTVKMEDSVHRFEQECATGFLEETIQFGNSSNSLIIKHSLIVFDINNSLVKSSEDCYI